jgi:microcystin-dependent protein
MVSKGTSFAALGPGIVLPYAGEFAPTGWLLCYGQAVSRTTYASLYDVIGTTYGVGDSSTTFNLPDCRGRVLAGMDNMGGTAASRLTNTGTGNPGINGSELGSVGGSDRHTLTTGQIPAHTHNMLGTGAGNGATAAGTNTNASAGASNATSSVGGGDAHPICQPTIVFNYIIKT